MAKSLSVANALEKNRIDSEVAFIPLLEVEVIDWNTNEHVETIRLARNTEDILYRGELYIAFSFDMSIEQSAGDQANVSITAKDYSRAIQARLQRYAGGVGSNVALLVVSAANLDQAPEVVERFKIVSASAENYEVTWRLGAENGLSVVFPRRRQSKDRCTWRYRDPDTCGYTGNLPSCDLTLQGDNGCAKHNNTSRYGAFPGISPNGQQV